MPCSIHDSNVRLTVDLTRPYFADTVWNVAFTSVRNSKIAFCMGVVVFMLNDWEIWFWRTGSVSRK